MHTTWLQTIPYRVREHEKPETFYNDFYDHCKNHKNPLQAHTQQNSVNRKFLYLLKAYATMRRLILRELEVIGFVFMLIGGLVGFSLPLEYILGGLHSTVPTINLVLAILALIGCAIVWKGMPIAGGLLGIIVGIWMANAGEFFIYRDVAGKLVFWWNCSNHCWIHKDSPI